MSHFASMPHLPNEEVAAYQRRLERLRNLIETGQMQPVNEDRPDATHELAFKDAEPVRDSPLPMIQAGLSSSAMADVSQVDITMSFFGGANTQNINDKREYERQECVKAMLTYPWQKAYMQRLVPVPELLHQYYPEVF